MNERENLLRAWRFQRPERIPITFGIPTETWRQLACGVDVLNLQDLVNGIDNLARDLKGRIAIQLDVDRQRITPFGSPQDIDNLIKEAVMKLGSPEGGLSLRHGLYSGAPLENIDALMTAMEKYSTYWS